MLSILSLLLVLSLSILVTRIASVALMHTGLSRQSARFQARSAFTGVGFTTSESEKVVNHPVRRRILLLLMLFGNAGIVTAVSSLIISFVKQNSEYALSLRITILVAGVVVLWLISASQWVDRHLSNLISWALKRYSNLEVRDFSAMLHLTGEYSVTEMQADSNDWMAGHSLAQLRLRNEGIMVLGVIRKNGTYIGAPDGDTRIQAGDTLILYGRMDALQSLDQRRIGTEGDFDHARKVAEQQSVIQKEKQKDAEAESEATKEQ